MVNFDCDPAMLAMDVNPDPCPSFMLFHQEEAPDLQATSTAVT
jgi:hypothetical protein